jgi:predicted N-acyltransferase
MLGRVSGAPRTSFLSSIAEVPEQEWDALFDHERDRASPFVRHAFLAATEASGSASGRTGWVARHVTIREGGRLVAAAPAWARPESHGDFSRDLELAVAAERAGLAWYPKLVVGVPFTPSTGRRLLVAAGEDRAARVAQLAEAMRALCAAEDLRGIQVLFADAGEARELEAAGFALRVDYQFHWSNEGYRTFDDFLARFPSRRRNTIRRELGEPARRGIAIRTVPPEELARDPSRWAHDCFGLHRAAVDRLPWGVRFVNVEFYERVLATMRDALQVVEARREGRLIAMAFNFATERRLHGRYWGCVEEHPFLHFNVALYHSIDACIRRGVATFEPGAGGEHKLSRGFDPAETWNAHWLQDPRLDRAVRDYLATETAARREGLARWKADHPRLGG